MRRSSIIGLPTVLALAACGGTDRGRVEPGLGVSAADPCAASAGLTFQVIEDFETGHAVYWWVNNDQSRGSEMTPAAGTQSPESTEIPDGRCGVSRMGLHLTARALADWGGSLGYYFFPGPMDTTAWDGVSLWVRRGPEGAGRSLFLAIDDKYTDEVNGRRLFGDHEPFCFEKPADSSQKCDRFTAGVGVEESWRFLAVPFFRLEQRGIGKAAPELDRQALLGVDLSFATGDWDLWIDDVAFYRE